MNIDYQSPTLTGRTSRLTIHASCRGGLENEDFEMEGDECSAFDVRVAPGNCTGYAVRVTWRGLVVSKKDRW